jgi:hypothetical protein
MAELGWDETITTRGLYVLDQALAGQQGLTRPEIAGLLRKEGLPHEGQATVHLIARAALEGALCQGPDRGKQPTYVRFAGWVGPLRPRPRPQALADLALRYLGAFAPAGPRDFAGWSGLPLGEARQAWQAIEARLLQVEIDGQPAWMLKTQLPWLDGLEPRGPAVRLLPRFDTYLLGYASRDLAVDPSYARRIHPGGGILRAGLAVDGRILGLWSTQKRRKGLVVTIEPFLPLPAAVYPGLEQETAGVGRFLGVEAALEIKEPR